MRKMVIASIFLVVLLLGGKQDSWAQATTIRFVTPSGIPVANSAATVSGIRQKEISTWGKNISIKMNTVDIFSKLDPQGMMNAEVLFMPIQGLDIPNQIEIQYSIYLDPNNPNLKGLDYLGRGLVEHNKTNIIVVGPIRDFGKEFIRGDMNNDYMVDMSDAISILEFVRGSSIPACMDAADANDDGVVNSKDAQYILDYMFSGGKYLPEPFPSEGFDLTQDNLGCNVYTPAPMTRRDPTRNELGDQFVPGLTQVHKLDATIAK